MMPPFRVAHSGEVQHHHRHHHDDPRTHDALTQIIAGQVSAASVLAHIKQELNQMADQLDAVLDKVTEQGTVIDSLVTYVQGLKDALTEAQNDPEQIAAIVAGIDANDARIAAVANTPDEGEPVTDPNAPAA